MLLGCLHKGLFRGCLCNLGSLMFRAKRYHFWTPTFRQRGSYKTASVSRSVGQYVSVLLGQ